MKVALYTLTHDRCAYTIECFAALREKAGHPFDHYIVDNGSRDDTMHWLTTEYQPHWIWPLDENAGISRASNIALRAILAQRHYDLVIKMDNDCLIRTDGILSELVRMYQGDATAAKWALSPRVEGINRQPVRVRTVKIAGKSVGQTGIIGGLFHVLPAAMYDEYYRAGGYPMDAPLARGQDDHLCEWLRQNGYHKGYVEDLIVEHHETTDGQARRYPDYFQRKWREESIVPGENLNYEGSRP